MSRSLVQLAIDKVRNAICPIVWSCKFPCKLQRLLIAVHTSDRHIQQLSLSSVPSACQAWETFDAVVCELSWPPVNLVTMLAVPRQARTGSNAMRYRVPTPHIPSELGQMPLCCALLASQSIWFEWSTSALRSCVARIQIASAWYFQGTSQTFKSFGDKGN